MKFYRIFVIGIALPFLGAWTAETRTIKMKTPGQEQLNWCWAAVTEAVVLHNKEIKVKQCDLADTIFGGNCCASATNAQSRTCDQPMWSWLALDMYNAYDVTVAGNPDSVIKSELNLGYPVVLYIQRVRTAHVSTIYGYKKHKGNTTYYLADPFSGRKAIAKKALSTYDGAKNTQLRLTM